MTVLFLYNFHETKSNLPQRLYLKVISSTIRDSSELPFPNYKAKYVKNEDKMFVDLQQSLYLM